MNDFLYQFNSISKEIDNIYRNTAKKYGLSDCTFWIIYVLRETEKSCTQTELCNRMFEPKQTVNSALKKLENDGYISLKHISNMKNKEIELTQKGKQLAHTTADEVLKAEYKAFNALSNDELTIFINLYRKLASSLNKELNK